MLLLSHAKIHILENSAQFGSSQVPGQEGLYGLCIFKRVTRLIW